MKLFILCVMIVSHTLAAPSPRKRDIDIFTYQHLPLPGIRQETTTHYCPEEDIPAVFIPSPPKIQDFPLPSLPNLPVIKYESPIPLPVHHDYIPHIPHKAPEYLPPVPVRQEYIEPAVPHESYGHPEPQPFQEYGLPGFRQETTTLPPPPPTEPITESTTLPPPPPTEPSTLPPTESTTFVPPVTEESTTHISKWDKLAQLKQHLKQHLKEHIKEHIKDHAKNIKLPEIQFRPTLQFTKNIEFPALKNWFSGH